MIHFYKRRLLCVSWYLSYIRAEFLVQTCEWILTRGIILLETLLQRDLCEVACSAKIVLQVGLTLGLYCSIHFYKETQCDATYFLWTILEDCQKLLIKVETMVFQYSSNGCIFRVLVQISPSLLQDLIVWGKNCQVLFCSVLKIVLIYIY